MPQNVGLPLTRFVPDQLSRTSCPHAHCPCAAVGWRLGMMWLVILWLGALWWEFVSGTAGLLGSSSRFLGRGLWYSGFRA